MLIEKDYSVSTARVTSFLPPSLPPFFQSLSLYTSNLEAVDGVFVNCDPLSEVSNQANFAAIAQIATSSFLPIMFGQLKVFALGVAVFNFPGVNAHLALSLMQHDSSPKLPSDDPFYDAPSRF